MLNIAYRMYIILRYTRISVKLTLVIKSEFTITCTVFGRDQGLFSVIPLSSVVQRSVIRSFTVLNSSCHYELITSNMCNGIATGR